MDYVRLMDVIAALLFVSLWCRSRFQSSPLQKQGFSLIIRVCRSSPALFEDFLLQTPPPSRLLRLFVVKPCPHGSGSSCSPSPWNIYTSRKHFLALGSEKQSLLSDERPLRLLTVQPVAQVNRGISFFKSNNKDIKIKNVFKGGCWEKIKTVVIMLKASSWS